MHEPSDSAKKAEQTTEQPARPKWRSLTWWLGQTPEQVAEINEDGRTLQQLPLWIRICMLGVFLVIIALVIAARGWLVLVPTVGVLVIFGVHYLITGKLMKAPLPLWVPIAFMVLVIITGIMVSVSR
jgi:hypothetical protein